ncbi:MAG: sulfurtransferase TusA family protein [Rhodospirillales bacterium]
MTASHHLDARGLKCPLPVLKARRALKALAAGERLEVVASDPSAPQDFRSFCETTGHRLVESGETDGLFHFLLEKAGP